MAAIITGMIDTMYRQSAAAAVPTSRRRRTSWWHRPRPLRTHGCAPAHHPRHRARRDRRLILHRSTRQHIHRPSRGDLSSQPIQPSTMAVCALRCCSNIECVGWVFALHAPGDFGDCKQTNLAAISNQRSIRHVRQHVAPPDSLSDTRLPSMSPSIAPTPLCTRLKRSVSFNLDWHKNSEEPPSWSHNASAMTIDLTSPNLRAAVAALAAGNLARGRSRRRQDCV